MEPGGRHEAFQSGQSVVQYQKTLTEREGCRRGSGDKTPAAGREGLSGLLFLFQRAVSGTAGRGETYQTSGRGQRGGNDRTGRRGTGDRTAHYGGGHHFVLWDPACSGAAGGGPQRLRHQGSGRAVQYAGQPGKCSGGAGQCVPIGAQQAQGWEIGPETHCPVQGHRLR